jgi:hypothetical protein
VLVLGGRVCQRSGVPLPMVLSAIKQHGTCSVSLNIDGSTNKRDVNSSVRSCII